MQYNCTQHNKHQYHSKEDSQVFEKPLLTISFGFSLTYIFESSWNYIVHDIKKIHIWFSLMGDLSKIKGYYFSLISWSFLFEVELIYQKLFLPLQLVYKGSTEVQLLLNLVVNLHFTCCKTLLGLITNKG